jgi:hypothetical protein
MQWGIEAVKRIENLISFWINRNKIGPQEMLKRRTSIYILRRSSKTSKQGWRSLQIIIGCLIPM